MKIQLQSTSIYPIVGGIENYIYYVSKNLLKLGHKQIILCSQNQKNVPTKDIYKYIKIVGFPPFHFLMKPFVICNLFYYEKMLQKFIKNNSDNIDAVWTRHPYYAYASGKVLKKIPIIYIQATAWPLFLKYKYSRLNYFNKIIFHIQRLQNYYIEKKAMDMCDQIVVLSKIRKKEICDFYKFSEEKFKVLPPGIDLERFKIRKKEGKLLKKLNIDKNAKIVLTVCRLSPEKNIEILIKAFSKIKSINSYLLIVGDGPNKIYLQQIAKDLNIIDKIRFLGFKRDVEKYFSIADVFVLPSKYEGFGHVYLEAMASGVPCIALKSDYPKIIVASEEIIRDGRTGYCVDPYSIEDLAEKIYKIISDNDLRVHMGLESRKICEENYSWENHVRMLIKLTKNVINK